MGGLSRNKIRISFDKKKIIPLKQLVFKSAYVNPLVLFMIIKITHLTFKAIYLRSVEED